MMLKKTVIWPLVYLLIGSLMIGGCTSMQIGISSQNEKYPIKPINVIVPFSLGTSYDMLARMLEKTAPQLLGQPLVVVNKPGGTGTIGWNEVVIAPPDGYTLTITGIETLLQPLYGSTKYDYPTALEPLAQIASAPLVMAIQAEQPWPDVESLIIYGRQHPEKLKFSHTGIGSIGHIAGEIFAQTAGIKFEQVPYLGGSDATVALLGGHVQAAFVSPAMIKEHIKNGTVRALAITGEQRLNDPVFAEVPTFKELGFDIPVSVWFGVAAPKELPREIKAQLAAGLQAMITDPEFKRNVENMGLQYDYLGPRESEKKWLADSQKLADFVQRTGVLELIKAQKN